MNLFSLSPNDSVEAVMLGNEALLSAFLFSTIMACLFMTCLL